MNARFKQQILRAASRAPCIVARYAPCSRLRSPEPYGPSRSRRGSPLASRRPYAFAFLLLLLVCCPTVGQTGETQTTTVASDLSVDVPPLQAQLDDPERANVHSFSPTVTKKYHIRVGTTNAPLICWITDTSSLMSYALIRDDRRTNYWYILDRTLDTGKRYSINVAAGAAAPTPIPYRLLVTSTGEIGKHGIDPRVNVRPLQEGVNLSVDLSATHDYFAGNPAVYISFKPDKRHSGWYRATATSATIVPFVTVANKDFDAYLDLGWSVEARHLSRAAWRNEGEDVVVILWSKTGKFQNSLPKPTNISLTIDPIDGDPNLPFYRKVWRLFSNPVISLLIGVVCTIVVSYYFFLRSVSRRSISFRVLQTRLLLGADDAARSHISVHRYGVAISEHVGLCVVRLQLHAFRDIQQNDFLEPISVTLLNVSQIIRVVAKGTNGWLSLTLSSAHPTSLQISALHLRPRDWIELDVYFTQKDAVNPDVEMSGKIVDGALIRYKDRLPLWRNLVLGIGVISLAATVAWRTPKLLSFLPYDAYAALGEILRYGWVPLIFYGLLTREGFGLVRWFLTRLRRLTSRDTPESLIQLEAEPEVTSLGGGSTLEVTGKTVASNPS